MVKLNINDVMKAFDNKSYEYYDLLSSEEKKAFSSFMAFKYAQSISGNTDLQEYLLLAFNEFVNSNYFDLYKHPKLLLLS